MNGQYIEIALYTLAMASILLIYLPFSPMTIDLVNFSRDTQLKIYLSRHYLWGIGAVCFTVLLGRAGLGYADDQWLWIGLISIGMLAFMFWSGYVPYVMTPPEDPEVLDPAQADKLLKPEDFVLGLVHNGQARAYPRDFIARPHFYTDKVGGQSVTVSYCILCNSGIGFKNELKGKPLDLECITAYNNNIIYRDKNSGNFIQQLDSKVIHGPEKGAALESLPIIITTWKEWKELHPDTKLYYAPAKTLRDKMVAGMLEMLIPISKLSRRKKPWHRIKGKLDGRLPAMSFVIGVELNSERCAYPIQDLRQRKVINDTVGGEPIVVLYDKDRDVGAVYSRKSDVAELNFSTANSEAGSDVIARDDNSGSHWNINGVAIDGDRKGQALQAVPHFNNLFWFSWALFKPDTRISMAA